MIISGKTRICGVIGDPIEHTLSPTIQNAAFKALDLDYVFLAFKVSPNQVDKAIAGMRALEIVGLNVTMPHKEAVIKHLDQIDENAKFLNAVNTIHNKDGQLIGYNTDGVGVIKALKENGSNPKGKKILLLGAGGSARAIAYALAKQTDELIILNRTVSVAKKIVNLLNKTLNKKILADSLTTQKIREHIQQSDILINATSVGMKPNSNQSLIPKQLIKPKMTIMDIVYNPVETKLAREAKSAGAKVVSGTEMLIYQGAASFEIWTGKTAPVEVMRKAALERLSKV